MNQVEGRWLSAGISRGKESGVRLDSEYGRRVFSGRAMQKETFLP